MVKRVILWLSLLAAASLTGAQEASKASGWGVPSRPLNCEMNLQNLEFARDAARRETEGFLIIVARLGDGERRRTLNSRRLHNVRLQLTRLGVSAGRVIVAEGERVKGWGRVELYVRGEMIGALPVKQGGDLCVGCCGPDEDFYPYRRDSRRAFQRALPSRTTV